MPPLKRREAESNAIAVGLGKILFGLV